MFNHCFLITISFSFFLLAWDPDICLIKGFASLYFQELLEGNTHWLSRIVNLLYGFHLLLLHRFFTRMLQGRICGWFWTGWFLLNLLFKQPFMFVMCFIILFLLSLWAFAEFLISSWIICHFWLVLDKPNFSVAYTFIWLIFVILIAFCISFWHLCILTIFYQTTFIVFW